MTFNSTAHAIAYLRSRGLWYDHPEHGGVVVSCRGWTMEEVEARLVVLEARGSGEWYEREENNIPGIRYEAGYYGFYTFARRP